MYWDCYKHIKNYISYDIFKSDYIINFEKSICELCKYQDKYWYNFLITKNIKSVYIKKSLNNWDGINLSIFLKNNNLCANLCGGKRKITKNLVYCLRCFKYIKKISYKVFCKMRKKYKRYGWQFRYIKKELIKIDNKVCI